MLGYVLIFIGIALFVLGVIFLFKGLSQKMGFYHAKILELNGLKEIMEENRKAARAIKEHIEEYIIKFHE